MKLKEIIKSSYKKIFNLLKEYYLILVVIFFFILKTHIFNLWTGLTIDLWFKERIITALGTFLLLCSPAIILKRKGRILYLLFVASFTSIIFAVQYIYNNYNNGIFSFSSLKYFYQLAPVTNIVARLINVRTALFFIDLPIILLIFFFAKRKKEDILIALKPRVYLFITTIIFGLIFSSFVILKEKNLNFLVIPMDGSMIIQKIGAVNYAVQDFVKYFFAKNGTSPEEISLVKEWNKNRNFEDGKNLEGIAKNKNVIIIQLESFQDFLLGRSIDGQEITPNLNKFSEENFRFTNFYYQVGPSTTADAEFTSLNSLYFLHDKSAYFDYPLNKYHALPGLLKENGYRTFAMHGYKKSFWNRAVIYPNLGFDRFYNVDDYKFTDGIGWGLPDENFFSQSIDYMKKEKKPFLSFMLTLSSHDPFNLPEKKQELKIDKNRFGKLITDYLQSGHYVDKAFGQFIDKLKKEDLYDNSVILIYGDHEGGLNAIDNKAFLDWLGIPGAKKENYLTHAAIHRIPAIIHLPNNSLIGESDIPASEIDVYPTIVNLLGYNIPKTTLGQDLFNTKNPFVLMRRNNTLNNSFMDKNLFYQPSLDGKFENGTCYDRKSQETIDVNKCLTGFNRSKELAQVNDIIVKGNKLDLLNQ